jgi:C-terminal region of aryl-sulfatase
VKENPRPGFLYWSDDGDLMALRYGNWKVHFAEQRAEGFDTWEEPFVHLRVPKLFNLRSDPFENASVAGDLAYKQWRVDRVFLLVPAAALVSQYMQTLVQFPPRQRPDSFTVGDVMEKLEAHRKALEVGSGGSVK